jgi:hypothetical protein
MGGQMANVIIEGNTIKADTYGTTYSYDSCMRVGSPAYIINNNISGIINSRHKLNIILYLGHRWESKYYNSKYI